jgi:hypothetical protein
MKTVKTVGNRVEFLFTPINRGVNEEDIAILRNISQLFDLSMYLRK